MTDPLPQIRCGDSATVRVSFSTDGTPIDLTGCRVSWTVRSSATMGSTSDDDAAIAMVSTDGGPSGVVEFALSPSVTRVRPGDYQWDAQLVDAAGTVSSSRVGTIRFVQDVTKDVA